MPRSSWTAYDVETHRPGRSERSTLARQRSGGRWQDRNATVAVVLVALALLTAISSLWVSVTGHLSRIELENAKAMRHESELMASISAIRGEFAGLEAYRRVRKDADDNGMVETRPPDCEYFWLDPEASLLDASISTHTSPDALQEQTAGSPR